MMKGCKANIILRVTFHVYFVNCRNISEWDLTRSNLLKSYMPDFMDLSELEPGYRADRKILSCSHKYISSPFNGEYLHKFPTYQNQTR